MSDWGWEKSQIVISQEFNIFYRMSGVFNFFNRGERKGRGVSQVNKSSPRVPCDL